MTFSMSDVLAHFSPESAGGNQVWPRLCVQEGTRECHVQDGRCVSGPAQGVCPARRLHHVTHHLNLVDPGRAQALCQPWLWLARGIRQGVCCLFRAV